MEVDDAPALGVADVVATVDPMGTTGGITSADAGGVRI
jgi:hypothetical protein